jgi:hypothetical protein
MSIRRSLALALVVAPACGGGDDATTAAGDYATQLERVSVNAHIQERGLSREFSKRLKNARGPAERHDAVLVFADQSARLYQDVVDALKQLEPPDAAAAAQARYEAAWQAQLDLIVKLRDAGFGTHDFLDSMDSKAFRDAAATIRSRCEQLQQAVRSEANGIDLACDGKP